ncbi:hypothetical protein HN51_037586 [Arachis hypogaea]|uniref:protein-disulfide reductase n=1 Tax=Arachis hypogaea TaxID=3818 RepID=A0A444ZV78_ARAHY|nr:probable nucleoredoxin 1 [Arachis ipaensis]XP_025638795.1 probable nucleoredoxin 1 [Arachis hypogaea]QHO03148.1 putative nucleoredoxin [Arachis hypogaea]RYR18145.1 hypothetical protein Ahy_B03g062773 [Arachis hypogaea]
MADSEDDAPDEFQDLFSSPDRDFLINNNGDQVKVETLKQKKLGLYFSASWCPPCQRFTPALVEVYNELAPKGDFEVVFISADEDDATFMEYFSQMPWLAIPFSDSEARNRLDELFEVEGIPNLVLLDETGEVVTDSGVDVIREYGVEGYPFTLAKIQELKDLEEEAKRNQSLKSLLLSPSRDFVISSHGNQIAVSELEGKMVGLYFSSSSYERCTEFTSRLVEFYDKLKTDGESFEIVMIPLDEDEESFKKGLESMPWLSLPFEDKNCGKLIRYFEVLTLPRLVIIDENGKTLHSNVVEAVEEHGAIAYPFSPEKFAELSEIEKAKAASQTLESLLVSGDQDFLIRKDGTKVLVSELVGKNILLYFSGGWCAACHVFHPKLIEAYHEIKEKEEEFEVIFISSDHDQASFEESFAVMPWLAIPYGDPRKSYLTRKFRVYEVPMLVAIGANGQTITKDARFLINYHGARTYPFTEERIKEVQEEEDEAAKGWPEKLDHEKHKHEISLTVRMIYYCDVCDDEGRKWSYCCEKCDFDMHPKCALMAE